MVRFNAYDNAQLKRLLAQRLGALPFAVFEDAGLELCARKVAAATGDMRRALNICAVAVDLCAREAADFSLCAANDEERVRQKRKRNAIPQKQTGTALLRRSGKVAHVARAVSASFSSPVVDTVRGLPQHQQMVLCAAVRAFRERQSGSGTGSAQSAGSTLGVLNDKYTALCKEAGIRGRHAREFSGVCTVLADQTLLRVGAGREDRQRKVSLAVHQDDVVFALQGVNFFRNLIGEGRGGNAGTARGGGEVRGG